MAPVSVRPDSGADPAGRSLSHAKNRPELAAAVLVAAMWVWLLAPNPSYYVTNSETGHQLAGAWNLLHHDQRPHLEFVSSYGPGRFWVSALGLTLCDGRLLGELLTRSVGFFLALLLLQRLLARTSGHRATAWLLTVTAAVALPPHHKYWTSLCPVITMWALYLVARKPTVVRLLGLGGTVGIAALFRPDYGLFALAAAVAVLVPRMPEVGRSGALGMVAAGAAVPLTPWLIQVAEHNHLGRFFVDWLCVGGATSVGLSMPHPLLHWQDPAHSLAFLIVMVAPLIGLAVWLWQSDRGSEGRRFALAVHVYALVNLVQSSHRADWPHLMQGVTPGFVSLGLVLCGLRPGTWQRTARVAVPAALMLLLATGRVVKPSPPDRAWRNWSAAALSKAEFEASHVRGSPTGEVVEAARQLVPEGRPTFFFPFAPQLHYFADRPFAAGLPYLAPGFFDSREQQLRAVALLRRQRPEAVFWREGYAYDGRSERNAVSTHAVLHRGVEDLYARVGEVAGYTVFRRDDLAGGSASRIREPNVPPSAADVQ